MSQFHSPIDPIFWRWHKWIDNIRAAWVACRLRWIEVNEALVIRILFGGVNDAPGLGITNVSTCYVSADRWPPAN